MRTSKTLITTIGILTMIGVSTVLAQSPSEYRSYEYTPSSVTRDIQKPRGTLQTPISTALPTSGRFKSGMIVGASHFTPTGQRSNSNFSSSLNLTSNLRSQIKSPSPLATRNSYLPSLSLSGRDIARIVVNRGVVGQLGF